MYLEKTGKSLLYFSLFFTNIVNMNPIRSDCNERLLIDPRETEMKRYEAEGKYREALAVVRDLLKEAEANKNPENIQYFSQKKEYLESTVLTVGKSRLLFDEQNQPRPHLIAIFTILGMDTSDLKDDPASVINDWGQKHLLRSGERWQQQSHIFESRRDELKPHIEQLQLEKDFPPSFDQYDGAVVHGALLRTVRLRIRYLIQQWERGVRFPDLYFLTGERSLELTKETPQALTDENDSILKIVKERVEGRSLPKTEDEMIRLIWECSEIPEDMRKTVTVHYVVAPAKIDSSGIRTRPNTNDTVKQWKALSPKPGTYLCASNAPYIQRQDIAMRTDCQDDIYQFETVGPASDGNNSVAIIVDEIARLVFQLRELQNKKHLAH